MKKCTFRTPYTRTVESIRDCNIVEFKEPSKVKKSLSYATKLSTLYDQYCKTHRLPLNGQQPIYDENFVQYDSLIEAQSIIGQASDYFNSLPAAIRAHYGNSLEGFVKAIHSNDEFLINSGVLKTIEKQEIVNPTPIEPPKDTTVSTGENVQKPLETVVEKPTTTA